MELILVRCGETALDVKGTCFGSTDVPLTDKGLRQMQTMARIFHMDTINAIYTSPLKRAKMSAEAINKYHNLPIETLDGLSERDYGHWENMTFSQIKEDFKEEYNEWIINWLDYEIPMGESAKSAHERNINAIKKIVDDNPKGKVIVVTHQDVIRNILTHFFEMELSCMGRFMVKNGSVCRLEIDYTDGYATLLSFNEI